MSCNKNRLSALMPVDNIDYVNPGDVSLVLECDWNKLLPFINSTVERNRAYEQNKNLIAAPYPLTVSYLTNYYNSTNFSVKKTFSHANCAADLYSYFILTFVKGASSVPGVESGAAAATEKTATAGSQGLNPFGFVNASFLPSWLWYLLIGFVVYEVIKK